MCAPRPRARGTQGDRELRAILSQPPGLCVFHFLTLLLHECAIPSFFLTLMIKSLLLPTRKREMQGTFQCHSTPQDWTVGFPSYLLLHCLTLTKGDSLSPLLFLSSFLFHFPAPLTFLFLLSAQPTLTIFPSPNTSYPPLKGRSLPNGLITRDF